MFDDIFQNDQLGEHDEIEFMPMLPLDDDSDDEPQSEGQVLKLPLVPLKNMVLFPKIIIPITVGRDKSIKAVQEAHAKDKLIGVFTQLDPHTEDPAIKDLYKVGTLARIVKLIKMPDGTITAIMQGVQRIKLGELDKAEPFLQASVNYLLDESTDDHRLAAISSAIRDTANRIIELSPNIPTEANIVLRNINSNSFLLNFIASNMNASIAVKQNVLEMDNLMLKAEVVLQHIDNEIQLLELKDQIESKVRVDIDKQQREYYLNQQLKTIQEELGGNPTEEEIANIVEKISTKSLPEDAKTHFDKELARLRRINPMSPDYSVLLNYLDLFADLPWGVYTKDVFDLKGAEEILNNDHFGLDKVKERILEHLAVLKLKGDMKSPILCLVGPPGVGKTSLGKSIATALQRKYIRMSLGGLHDESEIRGHRRTYIGAMPGRILQQLRKTGTSNPVFVLDEIDKIGNSFRGDPSSALLEVLDPEQNSTFYDNFLEVDYDLSKVLFIATANSLNSIQPALLDRMEIIHVDGYSIEEKVEIGKHHLLPKQREAHGLKEKQVKVSEKVLLEVATKYTRESGVRELDRQLANLMRYAARKVATGDASSVTIKNDDLPKILGHERFSADMYESSQLPGVAVGLAWTQVGGDILFIEASLSPGKGGLSLTGSLGDVMKESASTALSYLKANAVKIGIDPKRFAETDIHIHVPAGAIPKDGPSAGITMLSALTSAFSSKPLKAKWAMTGEITLRGKVLPVGGIKEKVLAARRANFTDIILCKDNERDILEIKAEYITGLKFHYVSAMDEVLKLALK
jgi:ATP-dependent Lon protease